jgi:glycerol-3-phosphate acyltransferase PlsX
MPDTMDSGLIAKDDALSDALIIALDAMGGDDAPNVVIEGAALARIRHPDIRFHLYGDEALLAPALAEHEDLVSICDVIHTESVISPDMKAGQALRQGRTSSMGMAVAAVKEGSAAATVSGGNTGALMALSKFTLRTMPGIDRPALVALLPTIRGESAMLDLGANVECSDDNLVQFAVMGAAYARLVLGLSRPKVALLNIGSEDLKGHDTIRLAAERLREADLPYEFIGFVEGDDIGQGTADVFVSDGFTGNIALKTIEGTAVLIMELLGKAFKNSLMSKLGYLLARGGLKSLRNHMDPNTHNGGMMLGLNGLVIKSHGGANASGFASAIDVAIELAEGNLQERIANDLAAMEQATGSPTKETATV